MSRISFDNINSWQDFKSYAESLPNKKQMGDAFEHLTYLYFKLDPKYSFYDEVYKMSDVPTSDLEKLNIPRQDLGIDLIAKLGNEYHPIQCKYHTEKKRSITFSEVSTFLTQLESNTNFKMGYIASTADNTSKNYDKLNTKEVQKLLNNTWYKLDESFFNRVRKFEKGKEYSPKPFFPREHQEKAVENAYKHFIKENNSRGKLIFPCGAGKSLTGYWMMEKLASKSTIVAVPSLSLIKQTLDVYLKEVAARNKSVKWLCICSDEGIGKNDDVLYKTNEVGVPCTTDVEYIKSWLKRNQKEEIIIFTTYQSGRIIADISKSLGFTFDLGIYDEAHKTVGKNESLFSYLLFEKNISIKNRIFMTATERFYRGVKDDVLTMDDPEDYGEVFSHMSFKEAIEKELLTDYKVITIEVKKEEVAEFIKENNLVKLNAKWGKESEARSLASMIALRKAMKTFSIKNAVSFHSSIERAVRNKEVQDYITETYKYQPIETFTVSGKLPTSKREVVVNEFANSNKALITNSRCLTEGVDVPNIDCIVFADPRKSKVDIVQALGRALRKKKGKEWGYVILPIIYDHSTQEIDNDNFQEILNIVRGLAANDERIIEEFKDKSQNSGRVTGDREEIFSIDPVLLEESELVGNLNIKLWEKLSRFNWMPFEDAREFARSLKLKSNSEYLKLFRNGKLPQDMPAKPRNAYKDSGFISIPDFLGYETFLKDWISYKEAKKVLKEFGFESKKDFDKAFALGKIPKNIPKFPSGVYKKDGWINWADFLSNKNFSKNNLFEKLTYNSAKIVARDLKCISVSDYKKRRPKNIPSRPDNTFKNNGWVGWSDYLGVEIKDYSEKTIPFEKAREFTRSLKFRTTKEWKEYCRTNKKPSYITSNPARVYKDKGWINMEDWLGVSWKTFDEAKKFVHSLNLKSQREWRLNKGKLPIDIPTNPHTIYKEFVDYNDWLNVNNVRAGSIKYLSFEEAKNYVSKLGLKGTKEWVKYCKSGRKPENIPNTPSVIYKKNGFISLPDFLGYSSNRGKKRNTLTYEDAKKICVKLKVVSASDYRNKKKRGILPSNLPSAPDRTYKDKGWISWGDFLGTGRKSSGDYLTFKEARIIVQKLNLRSQREWNIYSKVSRPSNIPSNPQNTYKINWKGWSDFLGKEKT